MKLIHYWFRALLLASSAFAAVDEYNIPRTVEGCLREMTARDFELSDRMNPFYLRGDFDGDARSDYAVLISQRETGKAGILICFGGRQRKPVRIGAGSSFEVAGGHRTDDLAVFDAWDVQEPDSGFRRDRLHLVAKEAGSGLIYWDGQKFKWRQLAI